MLKIGKQKWENFSEADQVGGRYYDGAYMEVYKNAAGRVLVVGKGKFDKLGVTAHSLEDMAQSMKECVAVHKFPDAWIDQIMGTIK